LERTLARRLREFARKRGRPLYVIAELAGFSRPAFWNILNGVSSPTLNTVQRLAAALDVRPLELLQGDPGPLEPRKPRKPKARAPRTERSRSRAGK
jgi:transcriptional regulator with XRE-family HTH domain